MIKSSVRRKVIGFFALNEGYDLYARQIARALNESPHAVGLELKNLVKGGVLKGFKRGRHSFYAWNHDHPFSAELLSMVRKAARAGDEELCSLPSLSQEEHIRENVERVVADIRKYYAPEKIILFGSAAHGRVGPHSDIDLVVVKETGLPFFKRVRQLVEMLHYDVDIDFLIYTPEEFRRATRERRFFREEIVKKGRVLYERAA